MDDPVEVALRRKKDSSMRVAIQQLKAGKQGQPAAAQACVSAGNTGALMAVARYLLKTLEGIDRPAIATVMPNQTGGFTTVLDLGANVDCGPDHLLQFAVMGSALVSAVDGKEEPSVGLLNIGEEMIKGNETIKRAGELLREAGDRRLTGEEAQRLGIEMSKLKEQLRDAPDAYFDGYTLDGGNGTYHESVLALKNRRMNRQDALLSPGFGTWT